MQEQNIFDETQFAHLKQSLPPKEYEDFISYQKNKSDFQEHKEHQLREGRKKKAGNEFFTYRNRIALRRITVEEVAPDEDVFAYDDIHNMKKAKAKLDGEYEDKMKFTVSDYEIEAFRDLEREGKYFKDITLEMIAPLVTVKTEAGKKSKNDDVEIVELSEQVNNSVEE